MNSKSGVVADYMARNLVTFSPGMDVLDAIHKLVEQRIAGAPVVDEHGELVGMLSELDCMKIALSAGYFSHRGGPVSEYMSKGVETIDAEMSIVDLAQKFQNSSYRRFPVMKNNRLVGQISRRDVLRALLQIAH
jgi:CBS domain-containing protein